MLSHNVVWVSTFNVCYSFGKELAKRGWEVEILTISPHRKWGKIHSYMQDGVLISEFPDLLWGPLRSGWDIYDTLRRIAYLRKKKYDLIWAFDSRPAVIFPALYGKYFKGIPHFSFWGDWWGRGGAIRQRTRYRLLSRLFEPLETFFEEGFRSHSVGMTTVSNALRQRAIKLGFPPERIRVINSGSDVEGIRFLDKTVCKEKLHLPANSVVINYSGFTHYDVNLVLDAFAEYNKHNPNSYLIMTGSDLGIQRDRYPELVLNSKIRHVGLVFQKEMQDVLGATDIFFLPLTPTLANEARFPIRFFMYCAAGRPVITNPVGDIPEYYKNHEIGAVVDSTPHAMATAVQYLVSDPSRLTRLNKNVRHFAETVVSTSYYTDKLLAFWMSIPEIRAIDSKG
ncbi:glycosyltransferase family 4 protein [Candidatus Latescibacterota bacterium]